ncbi:MAG TPA: hypothetical protein VGM39_25610 [Kofleriaceae bacterium]|jgi:hypothetical protein
MKRFAIVLLAKDGAWIAYATTDAQLDKLTWHVSPTNKAGAAQSLPITEHDRPMAWL